MSGIAPPGFGVPGFGVPGLGIYVHWPFCASKCPYCDFNSHVRRRVDEAAFRDALLAEAAHMAALAPERRVESVFFGGGTPSLMAPATVAAVLDAIARRWPLADEIEVTLEANPSSVEIGRLAGFAAAGVNRLSLGVQALDDAALAALGRRHSAPAPWPPSRRGRPPFRACRSISSMPARGRRPPPGRRSWAAPWRWRQAISRSTS